MKCHVLSKLFTKRNIMIIHIRLHPEHDTNLVPQFLRCNSAAVELLVGQASGQLVHLYHVLTKGRKIEESINQSAQYFHLYEYEGWQLVVLDVVLSAGLRCLRRRHLDKTDLLQSLHQVGQVGLGRAEKTKETS